MSLINDMLNDLEERPVEPKAKPLDTSWMESAAKKQSPMARYLHYLLLLLAIALLLAAGALVYRWWFSPELQLADENQLTESQSLGSKAQRNIQPIDNTDVNAIVEEAVEPNSAGTTAVAKRAIEKQALLTAINWSNNQRAARLQISLDKLADYAIRREQQAITLHLYGVMSRLPSRFFKPRWPVQSISVEAQADDLLIRLEIEGEFRLEDSVTTSPQPQIALTITADKPTEAIAHTERQQGDQETVQAQVVMKTANEAAETLADAGDPREERASAEQKPTIKPRSAPLSPRQPAQQSAKQQATPSQRDLQQAARAKKLIAAGHYQRAEEQLKEFIGAFSYAETSGGQQRGLPHRSIKLLASLQMQQQRYAEAETLLASLFEQQADTTKDIDAMILQGRLLLAQGKHQQALNWLMTEQPMINRHSAYYELLALTARKNSEYALSEKVYRELVSYDARRGDWWVGLGIAQDAQARSREARLSYEQALRSATLSDALGQYARQRLQGLASQ